MEEKIFICISNNIQKLTIKDIQTRDEKRRTILCKNNMHRSIKLLITTFKLRPEHFQNKNNNGNTELNWLCFWKMNKTIIHIANNFNTVSKDKVFENVQSTF